MNDSLSPQFQSYQGLRRITTTKSAFQEQLNWIVKWLEKNDQFIQSNKKYLSIKFLDTFFSDSIDEDVLSNIFKLSLQHKYPIKILILDPNSELSISRAHALHTSSVKEINTALFMIQNAINNSRDERPLQKNLIQKNFDKLSYIIEQLDSIKKETDREMIQIRFYDVLTETPTYIISNFLAKGLILHGHTAAHNPWMIFVDDITQEKDIYDYLNDNFDWVWDESNEKPSEGYKQNFIKHGTFDKIFLSHGHNELVTLKIKSFLIDTLKKNVVIFEEKAKNGLTIIENLENIISGCGKAIILLTKEDEQKNGGVRARQNVIHELGYCQSRFGRQNVLFLVEDDVEYPSNITGMLHKNFSVANIDGTYEFIRQNII